MNTRHPGRPKKTDYGSCKVTDCPNTTEDGAFSFCRMHYMSNRRGQIDREGNPLYEPKRVRSYGPGARCIVTGCGSRPKGRGLCMKHYQQWEAGVDLGVVIPDRGFERATTSYSQTACCCFPGCLKRPVNRWMCNKHAMQREAGIIDEHGEAIRELLPSGRKREAGWRKQESTGYILLVAPEGHPHARADGTIFEHRLVMEQRLGRYLEEWELVHHKNGIRSDNRPENLELLDGRAKRPGGPGHPPGHEFDPAAAAQVLLQQDLPEQLAQGIANWLKGNN